MIDWLTMRVPCRHFGLISGGHVVSVDTSGAVEWQTLRRAAVVGSWDTRLHIRTSHASADGLGLELEISGNPVKFMQGHNLFGSDDLPAIVHGLMERLLLVGYGHDSVQRFALVPTAADRAAWGSTVKLSRVDVTSSYRLPTQADVLSWLRAAEQTAYLSYRGRGQLVKRSTLYFGKSSRRWSLKLYSKADELRAPGHHSEHLQNCPKLLEWAEGIMRAEVTLRGLELERLGLRRVGNWNGINPGKIVSDKMDAMTMTDVTRVTTHALQSLPPRWRVYVQAWEGGADLQASLSRSTFYRWRRKLLPYGIDIAMRRPTDNVVPLRRVLEAVPQSVPAWASEAGLFWQPRRAA